MIRIKTLCILRWTATVISAMVLSAFSSGAARAAESTASDDLLAQLVNDPTVTGGLIVHVGCGDGSVTVKLAQDMPENSVVHALDTDATNVASARARLNALGRYGQLSADQLRPPALPYIDNVVNLLLAEASGDVPMDEVLRVLVPNGVAYIKTNGKWQRTIKPRPSEIDDWTHYLHGPDNNAVANDTVIAPPRRLQWQCGPKWTRHHDKMSSFSAMVSSGGRVFYIIDEGSTASIYLPSHWALIARDAFNGKQLWKRKIETWFSRYKGLKDGPSDAPRRLIADNGRVYATLSLTGGLTSLDAATGETIREYEGTEGTEEILLDDGTLYVLIGPGSIDDGRRGERPTETRTIKAIDEKTGEILWQHEDVVASLTMATGDDRVYYFNFDSQHVVALDRETGRQLWTSADNLPTPPQQRSFFASKLVVADGVVVLASGEYSGTIKSTGGATKNDTITALSAETGRTLWKGEHPPSGYSSPEDLFIIDGIVWAGTVSNGSQDGTHIGWDLKTGEVKHRFPADKTSYWFHHRCYSGRATTNYIMTSRTGLEMIDLSEQTWTLNHWVRGACLYGLMPANGLIYSPPAPCICYAETYLHSFTALAPAATSSVTVLPDDARLEKGPAYGQPVSNSADDSDWPTYRGSSARAGVTATSVPTKLGSAWTANLGGKLSALTVANGRVFVAQVDKHTVHALSAETGRPVWQYTAGGRVDSPPTCFDGLVLFGSADGAVYCLRADDGMLVWRFQAALADRRTLVYEQIESLWPVHGSVLVREGVAHFVAGRSAFVDGGMRLYRVDAKTGELVSITELNDTNPQTGENIQDTVKWLNMAVGRPDVLSCDGEWIYMRSQPFDLKGERLTLGPEITGAAEGERQGGPTTHLFCPTGFLDDTSFHRTYWLFGQTWSSGWCGYHVAGKYAPAGKIMVVDDEQVYAFGREPQYYKWTIPLEFRLYAASKNWRPFAVDGGQGQRRGSGGGKVPVSDERNYGWSTSVPILVRAMALADDTLLIAGPRDVLDESSIGREPVGPDAKNVLAQEAALDGQSGALLWAVSKSDGAQKAQYELTAPPVFDGMAVANGKLIISLTDGTVVCLGAVK